MRTSCSLRAASPRRPNGTDPVVQAEQVINERNPFGLAMADLLRENAALRLMLTDQCAGRSAMLARLAAVEAAMAAEGGDRGR